MAEAAQLVRSAQPRPAFRCTVCPEETELGPLFEMFGPEESAPTMYWICRRCLTILNGTHLASISEGERDNTTLQKDGLNTFYGGRSVADISAEALAREGFMKHLFVNCPDLRPGTIVDFGCGGATLAAAAARYFDQVYAYDLDLSLARANLSALGEERVTLVADVCHLPGAIDAAVFNHVLEHLVNVGGVLAQVVGTLNDGGVILFQVPLFKKEHLCGNHLNFFSKTTVETLARDIGLEVADLRFDHTNDFLTCVLRKPGSGARYRVFHLTGSLIPDGGRAVAAWIPEEARQLITEGARPELREDGQLLGPPDTLHDDIRAHGGGAYSLWNDAVHFSASDQSEPLTNGRQYTLVLWLP